MIVQIQPVVQGTPGGYSWGATADGRVALAIVGPSAQAIVVFDSPQEVIDFGAQASFSGVNAILATQAASSPPAEGVRRASPIVGVDGLPILRGG